MPDGGAHLSIRPEVLEHAARARLVRLVEPFADVLEAHGVPLAALAASDQEDRALVWKLVALVDPPDGAPAVAPLALRERLAAVCALATSVGREAIARADAENALPRATLGDEDLAATVVLDHPDIFARARPGLVAPQVNGFTVYRGADDRRVDLGANVRALESGFGLFCAARDRTPLCTMRLRDGERFTEVDVTHGRTPVARDHIERETLAIRQSTDTTTQTAKMILDKRARCLLVHASHATLKDGLRRVVGEVCAGDPDFFTTRPVYSLLPLADPASLAPGPDLPTIASIELRFIAVRAPNGVPASFGPSPEELRLEPWGAQVEAALRVGAPYAAKLALVLRGRTRPSIVEIKLPGTLKYARRDAELARAVGDLFAARALALFEEQAAPATTAAAE